jgi:steroid delta-isomerase-like uncharacterized protein
MSTQDNIATIERAVAAFNNPSQRDRYFDLYADNVVLHGFPPGLPAGKAGVKAFFGGFWEAFPDAQLRGEDVVAGNGDRVAIRYTIEGTHRAPFAGVAPTGKKVTVTGQTIVRFTDGKVAERWNAVDMLGLLQQLGAVPS